MAFIHPTKQPLYQPACWCRHLRRAGIAACDAIPITFPEIGDPSTGRPLFPLTPPRLHDYPAHHELSRRGLDRPPIPPSSSDGPFNCWAFLAGLKHSDPQRPSTALFGRISGGALARSPLLACTARAGRRRPCQRQLQFISRWTGRNGTELLQNGTGC